VSGTTGSSPAPWLGESLEMAELAVKAARGVTWTEGELDRAQALPATIGAAMRPVPPPVDPAPPVDPPPVDPEPPTDPPVDPPPPVHPEPADPGDKIYRAKRPLPAPAGREFRFTKTSALIDFYRNKAESGDHLVLADGSFEGFDLNRSFDPQRPVVIRAESPWQAVFVTPPRLNAPGHWLHELKTRFDPPGDTDAFNIKVNADHQTITRCWIDGADGIVSREGGIGHIQIGWNRFTGRNRSRSTCDHILFRLPLEDTFRRPEDSPHDLSIHYNFFWDPDSEAEEDHCIYFGDTKAGRDDLPMLTNVFIDYNLIHADMRRTRPLYLKRGAVVRRNQCDAGGRNFGVRHGASSILWANRTRTKMLMLGGARGYGGSAENHHDVRGNVCEGPIELCCGSDGGGEGPFFQAANHAMLAGNVAPSIHVGVRRGRNLSEREGGKTRGVKIFLAGRMPRGKVVLESDCDRQTIEIEDGDGGLRIPEAVTLTMAEVGFQMDGQASAT
jgi:hypothetical protein